MFIRFSNIICFSVLILKVKVQINVVVVVVVVVVVFVHVISLQLRGLLKNNDLVSSTRSVNIFKKAKERGQYSI